MGFPLISAAATAAQTGYGIYAGRKAAKRAKHREQKRYREELLGLIGGSVVVSGGRSHGLAEYERLRRLSNEDLEREAESALEKEAATQETRAQERTEMFDLYGAESEADKRAILSYIAEAPQEEARALRDTRTKEEILAAHYRRPQEEIDAEIQAGFEARRRLYEGTNTGYPSLILPYRSGGFVAQT